MDPPLINYVDYNSILLINPKGKMRQLYVPFRVQVIKDTNSLRKGVWVYAEEVAPHNEYKLLYRVTSNWWPYNIFRIQIQF